MGALSGELRVIRGGGWGFNAEYLRSASRFSNDPSSHDYYAGFRLIRPLA
jgi:formylglycine-generating enzyme required for sulfatase activity